MSKRSLVIVESPTKAKTINKILGTKNFVVKASFGHIRDLPKSKLGIDVDDGFKATYAILTEKGKAAVVAELKQLAKDAPEVYLCSDPDREGEAIAWHLAAILGVPEDRLHRVTYNEITPKAIKEAFEKPRKVDMNLVNSQQARRFLDRIVGYKLSPLLWTKILRGLSAGRVQSVAVRLLAEREAEIQAFNSEEYWSFKSQFSDEKGKGLFFADLKELDGKKVIASADDLEKAKAKPKDYQLINKALGEELKVDLAGTHWDHEISKYETKETRQSAIPPFSTSYLQQASANRLGFDAKRTMGIAQKLYEGTDMGQGPIGLITYMRTDSFSVSKDAQAEAKALIVEKYGKEYYPATPMYYKSKKGSQEAHECIRPTHVEITPEMARSKLAPDEHKLYDLIWRRFVSSQMAAAVFDSTTCEISSTAPMDPSSSFNTALFRANGRVMKFDGWLKVYGKEDDEDAKLPVFATNTDMLVKEVKADQHFTQPPPRFTDASLVKTLEQEGIGRPSTYASIISVIQERGYVTKIGKGGRAAMKATDLGMTVTESLVGHMPSVMDLGFTRDMEEKLDEVEEGKVDYIDLLTSFYKDFAKELKAAQKSMPSTKEGWKTDQKCPKCSGAMTRRLSKFGMFYACQDEKCKTMLNMDEDGNPIEKKPPEATGIKCDTCGGDVFYAIGRFGAYLSCENYKNKEKPCKFTMTINKAGEPHRKFSPIPTDIGCEKCKKTKMVVRVSNRGKKNNPFLSCLGFPKCRAAADMPPELKEVGEQAMAQFHDSRAKDKHDLEKFKAFMATQETDEKEV